MNPSVAHVGIAVTSIAEALAFYRDVLGLTPGHPETADGATIVSLHFGGVDVELVGHEEVVGAVDQEVGRGQQRGPGAAPHQRPVGEILRERREELRLDINDIGEILRIKPAFLAALEQSRPEDLPGPTYVIGFVRAYARHLGLDHDWVLARYKAESAGVHARPDLSLPVPLGERSVPGGPILLVALILAICGYGTWFYLSTGERTRPERVAAVPPALQMQPERAAAGPDGDAAVGGAKSAADAAALANPANARLSSGLFPGSAAASANEPAAAPPASPPAAAPAPPGALRARARGRALRPP